MNGSPIHDVHKGPTVSLIRVAAQIIKLFKQKHEITFCSPRSQGNCNKVGCKENCFDTFGFTPASARMFGSYKILLIRQLSREEFEGTTFWRVFICHYRPSHAYSPSLSLCAFFFSLPEKQLFDWRVWKSWPAQRPPLRPTRTLPQSQERTGWPHCTPHTADTTLWNEGRAGDRGYLRFAFALTGPPGFLIWCPLRRLGNKIAEKMTLVAGSYT